MWSYVRFNVLLVSLQPCASQPLLALLSLTLLAPWSVTSYPRVPAPVAAVLPTLAGPDWEAALLQLHTALDTAGTQDPQLVQPEPSTEEEEEGEGEKAGWGQEELLRAQRGDLMTRPLSPFPGSHSLESLHYQEGGEQGEGGKRNEALTSIAGGLQAFSREKGGFGFRFGKRRIDGAWRGGCRGRGEEEGRH
uniref:Pyroglutamylated RFamide peptide n=1 Tax=Myripristis murdjan TaxID=586833 RepID=A0A667XNC5_9TELE